MNAKQQVLTLFPLDKNKGYVCECCGQFVKVYRRTFNSNMAIALLVLYRNKEKGFVHLEKLLSDNGYQRCGDATYLRHFGLIEAFTEKRKDGSKRNGHYKITGRGILFAENKLTVPKHFLIFNNKLKGFEGEEINIFQALGNKFSYADLMNFNITENGFTTTTTNSDTFSLTPTAILYDGSWDDSIDLPH